MRYRGLGGAVCVLALEIVGCAPPDDADEPPMTALSLDVERLDVVHGAVRMQANMDEGSADVRVVLGGDCPARDVGRGTATATRLTWLFSEDDVADAIRCGLTVRALGGDGTVMTSDLEVAFSLRALDDEAEVALTDVSTDDAGVELAFRGTSPAARLQAGRAAFEAVSPVMSDAGTRFTVPWVEFADAVARRRPLVVDGASFEAGLSFGAVSLDDETSVSEPTEANAEVEEEPHGGETGEPGTAPSAESDDVEPTSAAGTDEAEREPAAPPRHDG